MGKACSSRGERVVANGVASEDALASIDSRKEELQVSFDNSSTEDITIITLEGSDQGNRLLLVSAAFNDADIDVIEATISNEDGFVKDVFKVSIRGGGKVPESLFEDVERRIAVSSLSSSRSSRPAIYGMIAASEVERLRPLSGDAVASDCEVAALELAAAEMAQASAELVAMELDILHMRDKNVGGKVMAMREAKRNECASMLERRISAMKALMATRREASNTFVMDAPAVSSKTADMPSMPAVRTPERFVPAPDGFTPARERLEAAPAREAEGDDEWPRARVPGCAGPGSGYEILFQGFNWESHNYDWYNTLTQQIDAIADAGFTCIWLPPPADSVSPQGYLPRDIFNLNTPYGSPDKLKILIEKMHTRGLLAIADIVINHRCAFQQSSDGKWNRFGGESGKATWDPSAITCSNPEWGGRGGPKQGDEYPAAPNIDHNQDFVVRDYTEWLKWLQSDVGFDGWRLDYVRGVPGNFMRRYIEATEPLMALGEFWDSCEYTDGVINYNQDAHRQRIVNWCDQTAGLSGAFDFTTKGILQEAVAKREFWRLIDAQGRPAGFLGMWPSRAFTFIDNHDTGSTLNHWPFPSQHLPVGYAYILTHPGTPTVFYDHFYQEQNGLRKAIMELVALRRKHLINARSKVKVCKAAADVYAATIDDTIAMKIGPGDWSPKAAGILLGGRTSKLAASGPGFAVWEPEEQ